MSKFLLLQLLGLLLAVAYAWLAARKDAIQIEANAYLDSLKTSWHRVNVLIRLVVFGIYSLALLVVGGLNWPSVLVALTYFLLAAAIFWLLFDYRLNTLRNLMPWYQGQNAKADQYATKGNKLLALAATGIAYLGACSWFLASAK